jgi:hypothetical protein
VSEAASDLGTTRAVAPELAPASEMIADFARGPLALAMSLVLLLIIRAFGELGQWSPTQTLALSMGMTMSMLVAGGFVQAMGRRGSICLALEDRDAAWRFLWMVFLAAAVGSTLVAGLAFFLMQRLGLLSPAERQTFVLAFLGLSSVWLAAGWLSLVDAPAWLGGGLAVGLLVGLATDRAVSLFSDYHLTFGAAVGFAVTMAAVIYRVRKSLVPKRGAPRAPVVLPPAAYLAYEAAPYFAYGTLYMLMVLIVHAFGWLGARPGSADWLATVATVELGLTVALMPLILAMGVTEHAVRRFWKRALAAQHMISGAEPQRFSKVLLGYHRAWLAIYLIVLASLSIGFYQLLEPLIGSQLLTSSLGYHDPATLRQVFVAGLAGYWLLGIGQFNSSFDVTLALPGLANRAILPALAVTLVVGVLSSLVMGVACVGPTLVLGASVYAVASLRAIMQTLEAADYHYLSSF